MKSQLPNPVCVPYRQSQVTLFPFVIYVPTSHEQPVCALKSTFPFFTDYET